MKINNGLIVLLLAVTVMTSCNKTKSKEVESKITPKKEASKHIEKHWSYSGETGPEHWAEIEKNSECGGKFQSPINIVGVSTVVDRSLKPLDIHYAINTKIHNVNNNGHSIQYNFEEV